MTSDGYTIPSVCFNPNLIQSFIVFLVKLDGYIAIEPCSSNDLILSALENA